jgi:cytochrome b561
MQTLHWVTAILVVVAFAYGPGGSEQRVYSASREFERRLHESLGIGVFALVALRVVWRNLDMHPDPPDVPRFMGIASKAVQTCLYVLLFALPITAITGAWFEGHPLTLLGGAEVGPWIATSHHLGTIIATIHGWLGDAILWLAGAHALAALYHHFILKDDVLRSMLPPLTRKRRMP